MRFIYIEKCNDPQKWYANFVGCIVPLLDDSVGEFKSRELDGHTNYISKGDAFIFNFCLYQKLLPNRI